ncbi:MAG: hypothetical protein M1820_000942 [Bogoriella megaspora]|nr:MAG: hypothetical protein M1820_000942 [Bogoriella megaspora]
MPMYEVEHICPLTPSQKDDLAEAITKIHSELFIAPRLFVNVRITDISEHRTYVAGKRRKRNRIVAHIRPSSQRTRAHFRTLCSQISESWNSIITSLPQHPFNPTEVDPNKNPEYELSTIFIMGSIVGGQEASFEIPEAGGEEQWMRQNWVEFKRRADAGEEEWQEMIQDVEERGLLGDGGGEGKGTNGTKHEE